MMMTLLTQAGIIPALLVVLVGMLVLYTEPDHVIGRRFPRFLLIAGALLAAGVVVAAPFASLLDSRLAYLALRQLMPALTGTLALILLRLKWPTRLRRSGKAAVILLGLVLFLVFTWMARYEVVYAIVPDVLLLTALWVLVHRFDALGIALGLASLALSVFYGVILPTVGASQPPNWLRATFGVGLLVRPQLMVGLAAALVSSGLRLLPRQEEDGRPRAAPTCWFPVAWRLGLSAILLCTLAYTIVWASIWDQTSDGIGGLFYSIYASSIAVASGTLMGLTLTRWRRSAGLVFAVLIPILMFGALEYGWDISYHALTDARAARIQRAVERFHDRNGRYPEELGELVPRDLLWVPGPVILQGYGWCYQGSEAGYRLGAFYRETWSLPFSLRIYASAGSTPEPEWACEQELAELKAQRDPPPLYERSAVPTREPLPTSVVPIPRTPVQPLIADGSIAVGTWSADGRYLFFGSLDAAGDSPSTMLSFLDAESGSTCQAQRVPPMSDLRSQHAWLPDGRLLFISEEGEMDLLTPCQAGAKHLSGRYPARFSQVMAYEARSGRILLKSEASFWILDGASLEARQVAEVSPNPYEIHWDSAAWSPGGERLAICRLNGQDRKAGSTLYLVAGDTGAVVSSLPLEYATDQHAPGIVWLAKDELLLQSQGVLAILDYRSDPPRIVNVLQDIFALDIAYPEEVSSMAWVVHPDVGNYHLAVRVNHPRNQDLYLYHSETSSVEVLRHKVDTILFFPDGEWEQLSGGESTPTSQDEYELVWVDMPQEPRRLVVQGHTPRDYPILFPRYLPRSSQLVFSSSQGISLVSVPDGEMLYFWDLVGADESLDTYVLPSPDGKALVARAEGVGLYLISLPPDPVPRAEEDRL